MPRNASGVYTLPAGNPVVPGTTIDSGWANDTLEDVANELTNSLSRTGAGGMLAPFRIADGNVTAPGLSYLNETNSGLYRSGSGSVWMSILGVDTAQFTTTGVNIPSGKTLAVTSNATIGGTLGVTGAITATGGLIGNVTGNVSGNAGTVTNGVYTTGSYADPTWITSLAGSKITGNITGNAANVTGTVAIANGGTGATTASGARTALDVPTTTGTGATGTWNIDILGNAGTVTNGVYTTGSYSNPAWITALAASKLTGTVALANGGTGASTATGARTAILPSYSGNTLKFLRVNAGGTDVEWASEPSVGTVTSVNASGGSTGLSFTGGPITSSGTLTLSGTLALASGGTGATTASGARTALDVPSTSGSGATGTWGISITGNAATVTNGVYTTGSYADPSWITSIAGSKVSGDISGNAANVTGTVAIANGGTGGTTASGARGNLLPSYSANNGKVLAVNGSATDVEWISVGGTGTVTQVDTGTGLSGGPITTTGTISLANTAVSPGSYTNADITVDAQGRITAASNGVSSGITAGKSIAFAMVFGG